MKRYINEYANDINRDINPRGINARGYIDRLEKILDLKARGYLTDRETMTALTTLHLDVYMDTDNR